MTAAGRQAPAVERAFRIIEHLTEVGAANPSELARSLSVPRTGALRVLRTLRGLGYVWVDEETGRYGLTRRLFAVGSRVEGLDLVRLARPHLARLRDDSGETAELAVLDNEKVLIVDAADSPASIRLHARPGRRFPPYRLATGRVLLSGLSAPSIRDLYRRGMLESKGYEIRGGLRGLLRLLSRIRRDGYASDERHAREDVERIAAPVRGPDHDIVAAVGIAGPAFRLSVTDMAIEMVKACATEISKDFGGPGRGNE